MMQFSQQRHETLLAARQRQMCVSNTARTATRDGIMRSLIQNWRELALRQVANTRAGACSAIEPSPMAADQRCTSALGCLRGPLGLTFALADDTAARGEW